MTYLKTGNMGKAILGTTLVVTLLLASCTAVPGQDITPKDGRTPEEFTTPSAAQVPGEDDTPSEGEVREKGSAFPAEPVPPPSSGGISETVKPAIIPEPIETSLIAEASPHEGLIVELRSIEPIESSAPAPGQVSGPAFSVSMNIKNSGAKSVDTSQIEITMEDSNGDPAAGMIGEPAEWFEGTVGPGSEASAVYVFTVAESNRDSVRVRFTLRPGLPAVVFKGSP